MVGVRIGVPAIVLTVFASVVWGGVARADFGIVPGSVRMTAVERDGTTDTRAGSHPYEFKVSFEFNQETVGGKKIPEGDVRDIETDLPAGLIGNPLVVAQCSRKQFDTAFETICPGTSQVGIIEAVVAGVTIKAPVFNLAPPPGVPARIGFRVQGLSAILDASVRTGAGYDVAVTAHNIPTTEIGSVFATIWGVPYDPGHDPDRRCVAPGKYIEHCSLAEVVTRPFLTLPSACTGPLSATVKADSRETPGTFPANALSETGLSFDREEGGNPVGLFGCERLPFETSLTVQPVVSGGVLGTESPAGLNVDLKIPQPESTEGLAEADLREAVVKLPVGMTVSPSAANGLGACSLAQIGLDNANPAACPDSSKLGTVEIQTPPLAEPLKGSVFVAQQGNLPGNGSNPFGSLLALYVVAEGEGVVAKIPGEVKVEENGQLTTRFGRDPITGEEALPQVPFSELRMHFFGGARAPLITPSACGTYTTTGLLTPYGNDPGIGPVSPPVTSSSSFTIDQGCGPQVFAPLFVAATANSGAGAYTPLSVTLSRKDREQRFAAVQITEPPGLLGTLKNVAQCPEPQASQGECPPESQIGETAAAAGPGPEPYWVTAGKVYLTGPYKGAPFGLSVVVPATAGPFNIGERGGVADGKPDVVRARIDVNSTTAQATVTTDPLPTVLQNIPLDIRNINVLVNRPGFIFNPTSCAPLATTAKITSTTPGGTSEPTSPFEATNCANLPFKPAFKASTQGKTSKANGASLTVDVTAQPGETNIHKVSLQLPLALPARLTTLQKACTEAQFDTNPAGCPAASNIGTATATTPVLATPLTGPAYLVSHGGAAFPDVEFVLQGENGIQIVLDGKTDIKKGITYSRFETIPDAPITSFHTVFPEGPHSALAANNDLCHPTKTVTVRKRVTVRRHGHTLHLLKLTHKQVIEPLTIPTTLTAQDNATITQNTKLTITECPKAKKASPKKKTVRHK